MEDSGNPNKWKVNIDGENGHIIAEIQSLVLCYGDLAVNLNTMMYALNGDAQTYSEIMCPLIWRALFEAGNLDIPVDWIIYSKKQDDLSQCDFEHIVNTLKGKSGWIQYATHILTSPEYKDRDFENSNFGESTINLSKEIIGRLLYNPNSGMPPAANDYKAK
jgi:hypothetical protein